ncbi:MAG: glutaminyl-peptide cyclotransferase [Gammaproteobacteria bacterium]|nr:glutaminyl-peptide cyclotransferase [Gammaproteobacteria bacterium]
MKHKLLLLSFLSLLILITDRPLLAQTPVYGYEVINRYPHAPSAYTQGLRYHEGVMYEGTGRNGQSMLKKYRLEDGQVLQSKRLSDRYFGEGIEIVGDRVFQLTWQAHMVFVYDLESFEQLNTFYNPTEGWGLTYDGQELILSDGSSNLYFIDPENFVTTRKVEVKLDGNPVSSLNELEYIDGEVWANIWQTDFIVRVDPMSGVVNSLVNLTGLSDRTERSERDAVLNGIAYDAEQDRLFVTGKLWSDLFEIRLTEPN